MLTEDATEIDRWIISKLNSLVDKVTAELENFDPTRAGRLIDNFVNDDLSNWYVRLNRKRFWGKEMSGNKRSAYDALYTCLMTVASSSHRSHRSMPTNFITTLAARKKAFTSTSGPFPTRQPSTSTSKHVWIWLSASLLWCWLCAVR